MNKGCWTDVSTHTMQMNRFVCGIANRMVYRQHERFCISYIANQKVCTEHKWLFLDMQWCMHLLSELNVQ